MNCQSFRRLLGGLLNQTLDVRTRKSLMLHQESCGDCSRLLEVRQSIRNIVRASMADVRRPKLRPGF